MTSENSRHRTGGVLSLSYLGHLITSHLDSGTSSSQISLDLAYIVSSTAVQTQVSSCSTQTPNYNKQSGPLQPESYSSLL